MFERFSDRARKALSLAQGEARRFNHDCVGPEHVLLGLIKAGGNGTGALAVLNVDPRAVRLEVEKHMKQGAEPVPVGIIPRTPRVRRLLNDSIEEARRLGAGRVRTDHLLLALMRDGHGEAARAMTARGVHIDDLRRCVAGMTGGEDAAADASDGGATATDTGFSDERYSNHPVVVQYRQLRDQLMRQRDEAVKDAEYEVATFHRDLIEAIEKVLQRVYDFLEEHPPARPPPPAPPQTPP
jgi:ATP-dependent Clp protease ATP-binding subunit ClpC